MKLLWIILFAEEMIEGVYIILFIEELLPKESFSDMSESEESKTILLTLNQLILHEINYAW